MGVDARWICHTCKTVCFADGARSILSYDIKFDAAQHFLTLAPKITDGSYIGGWEDLLKTLEDFVKWYRRHNGHQVLMTNDISLDFADLSDYRNEMVNGQLSPTTFGEDASAQTDFYLKHTCPTCGHLIVDEEQV